MGDVGLLLYIWTKDWHSDFLRHMAFWLEQACGWRWRCGCALVSGAYYKWSVVSPGQGESSGHHYHCLALRSGRKVFSMSPLLCYSSTRPLVCWVVNDQNGIRVARPREAKDLFQTVSSGLHWSKACSCQYKWKPWTQNILSYSVGGTVSLGKHESLKEWIF